MVEAGPAPKARPMEARATAMMEELTGFSTDPNEHATTNRGPKPARSGLGPRRRDRLLAEGGAGVRSGVTSRACRRRRAAGRPRCPGVPGGW